MQAVEQADRGQRYACVDKTKLAEYERAKLALEQMKREVFGK